MIDDADRDVVAWLQDRIADKFARSEGTAFTIGNGVARPRERRQPFRRTDEGL